MAHRLTVTHPETARAFHLAFVERLNPRTEDFRHVGAGVKRNRAHAREHRPILAADVARERPVDQQPVDG